MIWVHVGHKALWLSHIDLFIEVSLKEHCVNIHLVDLEVMGVHIGKQETEVLHVHDRGEGLIIINAVVLSVASGNP
jgi:hypothetical protein